MKFVCFNRNQWTSVLITIFDECFIRGHWRVLQPGSLGNVLVAIIGNYCYLIPCQFFFKINNIYSLRTVTYPKCIFVLYWFLSGSSLLWPYDRLIYICHWHQCLSYPLKLQSRSFRKIALTTTLAYVLTVINGQVCWSRSLTSVLSAVIDEFYNLDPWKMF
jgi:hypothetical protein